MMSFSNIETKETARIDITGFFFPHSLHPSANAENPIISNTGIFFGFNSNVSNLYHRRMGHGFRFLLPLFSTTPLFSKFSYKSFLFQNFHNHSFFLHLTISVDVIHHE